MNKIERSFLTSLIIFLVILGNCYKSEAQKVVPFEVNKKYGLKDSKGIILVKPKYLFIRDFQNDRACVGIDDGKGKGTFVSS